MMRLVQNPDETGVATLAAGRGVPYPVENRVPMRGALMPQGTGGWLNVMDQADQTRELPANCLRVPAGMFQWGSADWAELESPDAVTKAIVAEAAKFAREMLKADIGKLFETLTWEFSEEELKFFRPPARPTWVQEVENQGLARPTASQIASLIRTINSEIVQGNYLAVDQALTSIDIARISTESMVAIIRATYHRRALLQAWRAFLRSAIAQAKERGYDEKALFVGLV